MLGKRQAYDKRARAASKLLLSLLGSLLLFFSLGIEPLSEPAAGMCVSRRVAKARPAPVEMVNWAVFLRARASPKLL